MTARKCTKKRDARAALLFCQSRPTAVVPFSLTSPSSLLKVNAGRRWRGKYCFASRGEQIITMGSRGYFFLSVLMVRCKAVLGALSNRKHSLFQNRYFENRPLNGYLCRCKNFSFKQGSDLIGGPDQKRIQTFRYGGGGGGSQKIFFRPFGPQFGLK